MKILHSCSNSISTVAAVVIVVVLVVVAGVASFFLISSGNTTTTSQARLTQPAISSSKQITTVSTPIATSSASSTKNQTNITVGVLPTADWIPFFVAVQQGYFAQQALNVTIKYLASGAVIIPAVVQGSVQIGASAVPPLVAAREQGFDIKFVAPSDSVIFPNSSALTTYVPGVSINALAVLSSSGIRTWKDLPGKTIAVNALASPSLAFVEQALKQNGVDPTSVHFVPIAPPDWLAALQQKRVDAADFFEPFVTNLISVNTTGTTQGAFKIIGDPSHVSNYIFYAGYFSTSTWISSNPDIVKKFISALNLGVKAVLTNSTLARQALVTFLHMSTPVAQNVVLYSYPTSPIKYDVIQFQIQLALTWGLLKDKSDNADQIVDRTYFQLT